MVRGNAVETVLRQMAAKHAPKKRKVYGPCASCENMMRTPFPADFYCRVDGSQCPEGHLVYESKNCNYIEGLPMVEKPYTGPVTEVNFYDDDRYRFPRRVGNRQSQANISKPCRAGCHRSFFHWGIGPTHLGGIPEGALYCVGERRVYDQRTHCTGTPAAGPDSEPLYYGAGKRDPRSPFTMRTGS